ncbi:exodeoxyribonuclease V subunit alpha [Limnohabitans sp. Rim8]|uniref:exodeoxyribonuclease V subunit alpha n=1 Tax=Limnohabitans sp. Rim8 TaxID=1100718 RepID=UPI003305827E
MNRSTAQLKPLGLEACTALDLAFADFLQAQDPSSDPRHYWLAVLTSYQMGRGHTCLDLQALQDQAAALLGWTAAQAQVLPADLSAAAASLPWRVGDGAPLVLAGKTPLQRLYLRRAYQAEQDVMRALRARLTQPLLETRGWVAHLNALFPPDAQQNGQIDWQKVACALAARSSLTLITGGPGTGKTTTVVRLLALLTAQARLQQSPMKTPLRIRLAAPTGKAASRLGASIQSAIAHLPSALHIDPPAAPETLHRLLHFTPDAPLREVPELACDVVVVDEASMIDLEMMARLLAAVPLSARLILLGDKDQLASVEAGAVMAQLCEGADQGGYTASTVDWIQVHTGQDLRQFATASDCASSWLAQHTVMLRHSRRFAANSGIGQWAQGVNAGDTRTVKTLLTHCPIAQTAQDPLFPPDVDLLSVQRMPHPAVAMTVQQGWTRWLTLLQALRKPQAVCSDAQALLLIESFADFQVLCALRSGPWGVDNMNFCISRWLGWGAELWFSGRPVMVTRNDPNLKLMNGDVGMCLPTANGLRVAFVQAGHIRWVLPTRLDAVETVWAMTVHKSQGSEFSHVMLVVPDMPSPVLTRELMYTGMTRAKKRLTLVLASQSVLLQATAARVMRSGGLFELTGESVE